MKDKELRLPTKAKPNKGFSGKLKKMQVIILVIN